jgi:hypothetical protein
MPVDASVLEPSEPEHLGVPVPLNGLKPTNSASQNESAGWRLFSGAGPTNSAATFKVVGIRPLDGQIQPLEGEIRPSNGLIRPISVCGRSHSNGTMRHQAQGARN